MPVYTYQCDHCGVRFEKQQSFSDAPFIRCPECGKKALHKVYTPVGIVFKGSGFYTTDHRASSGGRPSNSSKTSSGTKEKSKSSKKADASEEA